MDEVLCEQARFVRAAEIDVVVPVDQVDIIAQVFHLLSAVDRERYLRTAADLLLHDCHTSRVMRLVRPSVRASVPYGLRS